jgi:hypothetical protein
MVRVYFPKENAVPRGIRNAGEAKAIPSTAKVLFPILIVNTKKFGH